MADTSIGVDDLPPDIPQIPDGPVLLTREEAARYLRCKPDTLRKAETSRGNRLRFFLAGRTRLYRLDDLLQWSREKALDTIRRRKERAAL